MAWQNTGPDHTPYKGVGAKALQASTTITSSNVKGGIRAVTPR